jgi:hypothetical protein
MIDDERKALRWLLGRGACTEPVRTADERRIEQHIGEAGARDALIRLLRSPLPLNPAIRAALACAFEQRGSSDMMLELILVRRAGKGRPSGGARQALEMCKRAKLIKAEEANGEKPYLAPEIAAKKAGVSRATAWRAKKAAGRAKAVRGGEN